MNCFLEPIPVCSNCLLLAPLKREGGWGDVGMCSSAVSEQDYLSFHSEMLFKALDQNYIYDLGHHLQSLMTSILIIIFDFQSNYHMMILIASVFRLSSYLFDSS